MSIVSAGEKRRVTPLCTLRTMNPECSSAGSNAKGFSFSPWARESIATVWRLDRSSEMIETRRAI